MHEILLLISHTVHCRIGSLEIHEGPAGTAMRVHCRIGSLEIVLHVVAVIAFGSLPYRQLRNMSIRIIYDKFVFTAV